MKLFYVLALAMMVSGCTSTKCKHSKYQSDMDMMADMGLPVNYSKQKLFDEAASKGDFGYKQTTKFITEDTSEIKDFYTITPVKSFSGIESAFLRGSSLILTVIDYGYFEQYSGPVVNQTRETHVEARPFLALFGSIGTIGILPLVDPRLMGELAVGCTEKSLLSSEPDTTRQIKTGKSEWKPIKNNHKILVTGFNKDYEFLVDNKEKKQVEIDLSSQILNSDLAKNTNIKVTCLDCNLLGQEEQALYKNVRTSIELDSDVRAVKASLIQAQKDTLLVEEKGKLEQAKLKKEESDLSALKAKELLQAEKQKQRLPLDEFKTQCKVLFKENSPDFGDCVLKLNELNDSK